MVNVEHFIYNCDCNEIYCKPIKMLKVDYIVRRVDHSPDVHSVCSSFAKVSLLQVKQQLRKYVSETEVIRKHCH